MFNKVARLEKRIRDLEKEISDHVNKIKKSKSAQDAAIHTMRKESAERELQRAKSALILAKAEASLKRKKK